MASDVWTNYRYRNSFPERGLSLHGRPAFTGIDPSDVGRYVIFSVRDPLAAAGQAHAEQLASSFGRARQVGETALFQTWTADCEDASVTVVGTGSGSPELELAIFELMEHTDADAFLYLGAAAGMHPRVSPGDAVISSGVVRDEGMTRAYVTPSFPGSPSYDVTTALVTGAQKLSASFHVGVTRSSDSDIVGIGRPGVGGFMQPHHAEIIDYYRRAGVLANDREASAVVSLSCLFGRRTGAVLGVADNCTTGARLDAGVATDVARSIVVAGLAELAAFDAARDAAGVRYWSPATGGESMGSRQ